MQWEGRNDFPKIYRVLSILPVLHKTHPASRKTSLLRNVKPSPRSYRVKTSIVVAEMAFNLQHTATGGFLVHPGEIVNFDEPKLIASTMAMENLILMGKIIKTLKEHPECDILELIPSSYNNKHVQETTHLSGISQLNRVTLDDLEQLMFDSPHRNLLSDFPSTYQIDFASGGLNPSDPRGRPPMPEVSPLGDTLERLDCAKKANVVFPLSETVSGLISSHEAISEAHLSNSERLVLSLKRLLRASEKLSEDSERGAVFKCSDKIVAKVTKGVRDFTEFTSLKYLQDNKPGFPVPRTYGLINIGCYWALFMSYIPSVTLEKVWLSLAPQYKKYVQHQLDALLTVMRCMTRSDGLALGGVRGESVKGVFRGDHQSQPDIRTVAEFEDFKLSISNFESRSHIDFLKTLLPAPATRSVFTHGDFRAENILVQRGGQHHCMIVGIISWKNSGWYPEHHEVVKSTTHLDVRDNTDWYRYLPECIAPRRFPQWWLVNRLCEESIRLAKQQSFLKDGVL